MWVLAGAFPNGRVTGARADVWSSSDGINWSRTSNGAFPARYEASALAFGNKLWLMGGYGFGRHMNDVWSSPDGVNWTQATAHADWSKRASGRSVAYGGRMWLLSGISRSGSSEVWSSADGSAWSLATGDTGWGNRHSGDAVVFKGRIWMISGQIGSTLKNDVWQTSR